MFIKPLVPDLWEINIDTDGCLIGFGFAAFSPDGFGTCDSICVWDWLHQGFILGGVLIVTMALRVLCTRRGWEWGYVLLPFFLLTCRDFQAVTPNHCMSLARVWLPLRRCCCSHWGRSVFDVLLTCNCREGLRSDCHLALLWVLLSSVLP